MDEVFEWVFQLMDDFFERVFQSKDELFVWRRGVFKYKGKKNLGMLYM